MKDIVWNGQYHQKQDARIQFNLPNCNSFHIAFHAAYTPKHSEIALHTVNDVFISFLHHEAFVTAMAFLHS